jgi:hypothetical protein
MDRVGPRASVQAPHRRRQHPPLHARRTPLRAFRLDKFVVLRDPSGKVLEIVVKECVSRAALPEAKALLEDAPSATEGRASEESPRRTLARAAKTIDLYTHVYWTAAPTGSTRRSTVRPSPAPAAPTRRQVPWLPLRWTAIDGEDYGWGHVDSFLGDLSTLDMLSQALTEGSAAAARVVYLKAPGSVREDQGPHRRPATAASSRWASTTPSRPCRSRSTTTSRPPTSASTRRRSSLSFAFLLNTAIQRQGERVTAEEIRYMAQELEDALGGVYSVLSQELQLPYVRRRLFVMSQQKAIPALPNDIKPVIITGLEALGRGNDWNRLLTWLSTLAQALGPEIVAQYMNPDEIMRRGAVALSIDTKGLIKTPDQIAAAQQQAQMAQMVQQLGPQAVSAMGGIAKTHLDNQSKEQIANGKRAEAGG